MTSTDPTGTDPSGLLSCTQSQHCSSSRSLTDRIEEEASLQPFNTLGLEARARYLCPAYSEEDVAALHDFACRRRVPLLPLGEGSNVVFNGEVCAVVMPVRIPGVVKINEQTDRVLVRAGAGENWHALVRRLLDLGYYGVQNLSLIPGNTGGAPVQNIGAYGVSLEELLESVRGYRLSSRRFVTLNGAQCDFGYRDSVFKRALKDDFIITSVTLRLSKTLRPGLHYAGLKEEVEALCRGRAPSGHDISDAVCRIRRRKLPDPAVLGNAGSFFKNPVVPEAQFGAIRSAHPDVVAWPDKPGYVKLAAGWLIDACGLKGYRQGDAGIYERQALVIVNHGCATGREILMLAQTVVARVCDTSGVTLETEPAVIPA